ncbi:MAG: UPF0182 family protein [Chloroflexota bacterium]|nr:UPF0182 family protein [Chloroflexota bacterium]
MAFYRGGGARSDVPSIDWDEIFRRQPPDLRRPILIGAVLILFWIAFSIGPRLYTDFRWFEELGFASVFTTEWQARIAIFFIAAAAFFLFFAINIFIAHRLTPRITDESSRWAQLAAFAGRSVTFLLMVGGLLLAVIVGLIAQADWLMFLRYQHAAPFGVTDPIFNQDVAFYVFTLPVYQFLVSWLSGVIILAALATGATYMLGLGRVQWTGAVKAHLSALGFLFLLINAWSYQLDVFGLVYSSRGVVFGASYTDVNAQLPAYNIMTILAAALAVLLLVNIFIRALKAIGLAVALWIAAAILLGGIYPDLVQNFEVKPSELSKEQPYIKYNIALTRQAYALDGIQETDYAAEDAPSTTDIQNNQDTINNIRLSDYRPLLQTYNQIQTIRTYYDFSDVDIDRYTIDGKYRQVMLSARELATQKLTDTAQTWVNLHLVYTHGYGVVLSPVNEFTPDGLPSLLLKDIPPVGAIPVTRPEIYFGEETTGNIFVKTKEQEFDYPKGNDNAFSTYAGTGGVSVGSLWDRLMFALRFGDMNILLTNALTADSRVMFNRDIQTRIRRVAPFLLLDKDPYLVIADGKLYWMQDAYTYTNGYPFSEPYSDGLNYIRNSVKVVIDAYNGTTTYYVTDANEPIIKSYMGIFPALFRSIDQMPASLRAHVRYPETLFNVQAAMYSTYHMTDPQVFYNKEDLWAIPNDSSGDQSQPMQPYYVIMRLPGDTKEEFMLMLPFTPAKRQNMVAWMSAKSDGTDYGKRLVYRFPKDKLIYGPEQIHARLNQDPAISAQLTLLNQRGSSVVFGNLLVIPIEKSMIYVQSLYLLAQQSQIPQLKYVIVATGNSLSMQPTLGEALTRVFSGLGTPIAGTPPPTTTTTTGSTTTAVSPDVAALAKEANDHYTKAQDALKIADWATYGAEMKLLQQALDKLVQATGQK